MTAQATEAVIDEYYRLLQSRDRPALLELLSDDITVDYYGPPGLLPWIGTFSGKDGFNEFFNIIAQYLDIVRVDTLDKVVDDKKFVVQCEGVWRVNHTGKDVHGNMVNVFTVTDGSISRYEVYNDTAAFVEGMR